MAWYDALTTADETLARGSPAGLAVVHTTPYALDSGQRWVMFPYMNLISRRTVPILLGGGKAMIFMPPRHGKSLYSSVYAVAWFVMLHQTKNVILTSYGEDLAVGFSGRARSVVDDLGHLFGVRVHPKRRNSKAWQIQTIDAEGHWRDGGNVYAAGVDGALPGRGAQLIVMDDVVRGHRDTTPTLMEKVYRWYHTVLEPRREPLELGRRGVDAKPGAIMLVMTRWAQADLAGRLLEDEAGEWNVTTLPALAKEDDPLGRQPGEALCPSRFSVTELEARRDSSDEGGLIFAALYQQEPMPEDGAIFKANMLLRWETVGETIRFGNTTVMADSLKLWFATIDPALKDKQLNDPTGFLVWAIAPGGELLLMEDHTKRMQGSTDLIPLMHMVKADHPGIHFFVEDAAHGTEIMRACLRTGLPTLPLKADRDKVTRAIGAQPAFAASKVFLPAHGSEAVVRELLEFPGGRHDDRVDCVAYAIQVWRDRGRLGMLKPIGLEETAAVVDTHDTHPDDLPDDFDDGKDECGRWMP